MRNFYNQFLIKFVKSLYRFGGGKVLEGALGNVVAIGWKRLIGRDKAHLSERLTLVKGLP